MPGPAQETLVALRSQRPDRLDLLRAGGAAVVIPPSPAHLALRREIEAIGEARGEANALVVMLEARGFTAAGTDRERLTGCDDVALLRRWITRTSPGMVDRSPPSGSRCAGGTVTAHGGAN
jgi:hypothetical protein